MTEHCDSCILRHEDDIFVAELTRSDLLDRTYIEEVRAELTDVIRTHDRPKVVLDMRRVQTVCSAALGMLSSLDRAARSQEGMLCLAHVCDDVLDVLRLVRLNRLLRIAPTTPQAVAELRNATTV